MQNYRSLKSCSKSSHLKGFENPPDCGFIVSFMYFLPLEILKRAPYLKVTLLLLYLLGMSDIVGLLLLLAMKGIKN